MRNSFNVIVITHGSFLGLKKQTSISEELPHCLEPNPNLDLLTNKRNWEEV